MAWIESWEWVSSRTWPQNWGWVQGWINRLQVGRCNARGSREGWLVLSFERQSRARASWILTVPEDTGKKIVLISYKVWIVPLLLATLLDVHVAPDFYYSLLIIHPSLLISIFFDFVPGNMSCCFGLFILAFFVGPGVLCYCSLRLSTAFPRSWLCFQVHTLPEAVNPTSATIKPLI